MGSIGSTLIIVSAHNKEQFLGKTIDLIRATGVKADILVVNDGSTDGTSRVAMQKGCDVINFAKNHGKSSVCLAGMKEALRRNATAVVTFDADTTEIPKLTLEKLAQSANDATSANKTRMFVAPYEEGNPSEVARYQYSGVRSFSRAACWKLRKRKVKSAPYRFGWEEFLNLVFKEETELLRVSPVRQRVAFASASATQQSYEIIRTRERMARKGIARFPPGNGKPRRK